MYQRQQDGGLRELHKPSGGAWGGEEVNQAFYLLLVRLIGGPVWQKFREECTFDYQGLQQTLEAKKRETKPDTTGKITFDIPVSISQSYLNDSGETVTDAIEGSNYKGKIRWINNKMRIDATLVKDLFKPCTNRIVAHIKYLLQKPEVQGTRIFCMVGCFSGLAMVQDAIMKNFPECQFIIPDQAGLSTLRGAVIFAKKKSGMCPALL